MHTHGTKFQRAKRGWSRKTSTGPGPVSQRPVPLDGAATGAGGGLTASWRWSLHDVAETVFICPLRVSFF